VIPCLLHPIHRPRPAYAGPALGPLLLCGARAKHDRFFPAKAWSAICLPGGCYTAKGCLWRSPGEFSAATPSVELSFHSVGNRRSNQFQVSDGESAICASKPAGKDGRGGKERQQRASAGNCSASKEPWRNNRLASNPAARPAAPVSFAGGANRGLFERLLPASIGAGKRPMGPPTTWSQWIATAIQLLQRDGRWFLMRGRQQCPQGRQDSATATGPCFRWD